MNPFEFVNAINTTKKDIMVDDVTEKAYNGYMVNRSLSYFPDTILLVNEMNIRHNVDNRCQFDFLINTVRKQKRFAKWAKPEKSEVVDALKAYYGYSNEKARIAASVLTEKQIVELIQRIYKGGTK